MTERGRIRRLEHALVERDFSGLRWGAITPTDIDAFLEFDDRLFIFIEGKLAGAAFRGGQFLALTRLVKAVHQPPRRYSFGLLIDHNGETCVDYSACRVRTWLFDGEWRAPKSDITCKEAVDRLRAYVANQRARRVA